MKKIILIILITFLSLNFIHSEENKTEVTWSKHINWETNSIEIKILSPMNSNNTTLAAKRIKAENWVEDNLTNIFFKNILDIPINSLNNVSEIINENPEIYYRLDALGEGLEPKDSILSTNLGYLESIYSFPIYPDFLSVFYNQSQHYKLLKKLDHLDYGNFTGLIIYIPVELPEYQKQIDGKLTRVLFPKIYDEDMNLVMDYTMVEPEYMEKWGMVIYGESYNEHNYQERIGITPLRTIAKGLFGKNSCDIIISKKEADKLIGATDNLKIISQARVLIINRSENAPE